MNFRFQLPVVLLASTLAVVRPAAAAGRYGNVEFANSGAASAQADFLEGLALLHDFEYPSAVAAFRRAEAADSGFVMAYWGEAMTFNHPIWMEQDRDSARVALNKLAPTPAARRARALTERERAYLDAVEMLYGEGSKEARDLRYSDAMAAIHRNYPDDVDAAAFYGLSILGTAHAGRDIATYMRAAAVLEEAWSGHREHPGLVHYLIHSYDDPAHAPLGLRAARIYAKIAPDAGHAQHMTSHIFLALGMWQESVDANVAAIAAVDRQRAAAGKPGVCCGHYPSWLAYSYLQLGRTEDARRVLECCRASLASEPPSAHAGHSMGPDLGRSFASMRLRHLLDSDGGDAEVASWPMSSTAGPGARLDFAFARTWGEISQGHAAAARRSLTDLEAAGREAADAEAARSDPDSTARLRPRILLLEAQGMIAELEGAAADAEGRLRTAVSIEDELPIAFGPPTIDKPTHELFGEFLRRRGRNDEARAEFEKALARTPRRRLAAKGYAAAAAASGGSR